MGGYIAFEIMRQAPQRVLNLALMDTGARPKPPSRPRAGRGRWRWRVPES
jgi:pimeloyl-ACP methyl ester carboxylesterase